VALAVGLITAVGLGVVACSGDEPPRSSARSATPQQAAGPLRAVPLDGAALDVGAKTNPLPDDPSYFPIGVWLASVTDPADIEEDQDAGLNLYVGLTANSDLEMVAESDMKVLAHDEWFDRGDDPGSEAIAGWVLGDEVDMTEGPVRGPRTMQSRLDEVGGDGRLTYANYGKGVMFWETDAEAARFVNEFQDIVSNDIYWFTDPNVCGASEGGDLLAGGEELDEAECRLAANYGKTVSGCASSWSPPGSKPVWNFVGGRSPVHGGGRSHDHGSADARRRVVVDHQRRRGIVVLQPQLRRPLRDAPRAPRALLRGRPRDGHGDQPPDHRAGPGAELPDRRRGRADEQRRRDDVQGGGRRHAARLRRLDVARAAGRSARAHLPGGR
jgi:hypothetical protein